MLSEYSIEQARVENEFGEAQPLERQYFEACVHSVAIHLFVLVPCLALARVLAAPVHGLSCRSIRFDCRAENE